MVFDDGLRRSLFRVLQADPRMSQRALAKALGISLGKANYCLKAFIGKGTWYQFRQGELLSQGFYRQGMGEAQALSAQWKETGL
jgi:hypothetical protein